MSESLFTLFTILFLFLLPLFVLVFFTGASDSSKDLNGAGDLLGSVVPPGLKGERGFDRGSGCCNLFCSGDLLGCCCIGRWVDSCEVFFGIAHLVLDLKNSHLKTICCEQARLDA